MALEKVYDYFHILDQLLAITYGCQRADFLISIHTFLDNRTDRILSDRIRGTYEYLSGSPPVGSRR